MIIRPSFTVLSGAAVGLVGAAAVYGAVSSSATPPAAKSVVAVAPVPAAQCARGQKLEDGVCVIHVVRTVLVPATAAGLFPAAPQAQGATPYAQSGTASSAPEDAATPSSASAETPAAAAPAARTAAARTAAARTAAAKSEAEGTETEVGKGADDATEGSGDAAEGSESHDGMSDGGAPVAGQTSTSH
ncbi:MAG: hypothetical protein ABI662_06210 [Dermatophilaceae bacterium]